MIKAFTLIGVAALLATVSVRAQEAGYPLVSVPITLPAVVPAANDPTNFAAPVLIDLKKIKVTTVNFKLSASVNATNVLFKGCWAMSDGTLDTNNPVSLYAYAGASTPTATCTNTLTGNGRRYFYIISEAGAGGGVITNNSAEYGQVQSSL